MFSLMLESLFIDAGDVFLVATRGDFLGQFLGEQRTEPAAYSVAAQDSEELLHARVPGFHDAIQIDGQDADVQGLDDVFAEILEPCDFQSLLLK